MHELHAASQQRTRLAPKFSKSISLIATIFSIGMQFANHTCESNVLDQHAEGRRSRDSVQRAVVNWVAVSFSATHRCLHCLADASLGRMGIVLYVAWTGSPWHLPLCQLHVSAHSRQHLQGNSPAPCNTAVPARSELKKHAVQQRLPGDQWCLQALGLGRRACFSIVPISIGFGLAESLVESDV